MFNSADIWAFAGLAVFFVVNLLESPLAKVKANNPDWYLTAIRATVFGASVLGVIVFSVWQDGSLPGDGVWQSLATIIGMSLMASVTATATDKGEDLLSGLNQRIALPKTPLTPSP